jgi:serine/threonine-protein kinase HipA
MPYQPVEVIEVLYSGERIGALVLDPGTRYYAFEYTAAWRRKRVELCPLTMPTTSRTRVFVFPLLPEATYRRLPAMIADSLPDAFGNALVDAALAAEGVQKHHITPLDRLAYLGKRAVGALEYRPARGPRERVPTAVVIADLVDAARAALAGQFGTDDLTRAALASLIAVGTSAGGARAKAVIAFNPRTGEIRSGQLPAPDGFEHWLIKFDGVGKDTELGTSAGYGRIEYAYYLMARAAGITMSDSRLLEENGRAHFMTRRFDRDRNTKIHMQTLCAMAELDFNQRASHDYSQYLQTIDRLGLGAAARTEGFRRMAFNLYSANCDDHTKNLSFLMAPDGAWSLAPAYDVTHAHNPSMTAWTAHHQMSVNGRFSNITVDDIETVADRQQVPGWREAVEQVRNSVARWHEFAAEAQVDHRHVEQIARDMRVLAPRST